MMAARPMRIAILLTFAALCAPALAHASAPVTNRADALRTGWYRDQARLSPGVVTGGTFGQLFSTQLEGQIYAQPLVADGTLLIATEENNVYGLDPETGERRWSRNLGTPFDAYEVACGDLLPSVGVTSTPVIDPDT